MKFTDACLHPYPVGDSSLRRMALECRELGYDSAIVIAEDVPEDLGIEVLRGYILHGASIKEILASMRSAPENAILLVEAGDYNLNRAIVKTRGIKIIRGLWKIPAGSIDHIVARFAAERGIAFDIELWPLVKLRGQARQRALQRYREILMYSRRTECHLTISTGAHSILEQRGVRDAILLCALFGMERREVLDALGMPAKMAGEGGDVRVVNGS